MTAATERFGRGPTEAELAQVATERAEAAIKPFSNPALRRLLVDLKSRSEMVIDEVTEDAVTYAGYDVEKAKGLIQRFEGFVRGRADEITALQIILGRPQAQRRLTYAMIEELRTALLREPIPLDAAQVWQAYERLRIGKVRRQGPERVLTDIVQLVRFAAGQSDVLEPFTVEAERRFNLWLGRQKKAGRGFSDKQETWLRLVLAHLSANAEITRDDIRDMPDFSACGGLPRARALFGADLDRTLDDLTEALVA